MSVKWFMAIMTASAIHSGFLSAAENYSCKFRDPQVILGTSVTGAHSQ